MTDYEMIAFSSGERKFRKHQSRENRPQDSNKFRELVERVYSKKQIT